MPTAAKTKLLARSEFARGVHAAAGVMEGFNGSTTHPFRLDDVILCKLNVVRRAHARKNKQKLQHPDDAWIVGVAVALAEMCRNWHDDSGVVWVAKHCGLTVESMKKAGVAPFDWKVLKTAGVAVR